MKKILSILGAVSLTTTGTNSVVACYGGKTKPEENQKKKKYSNFYVLGDSLSDSHGIESYFKNETWAPNIKVGVDEINNEAYQNGSFTNGKTAAVLLNEKLGFEEITPGIINDKNVSFGRNYAVANSTAQEFDTKLYKWYLNKVTIEKQAQALVQQHKLYETDLVLIEVGGNDIKNIFDNYKKEYDKDHNNIVNIVEKIVTAVKKSVNNIKYAIEILLNNGIRKIIFSDPPNLSLVPKYKKNNLELKKILDNISLEFHLQIKEIIKQFNIDYSDSIREWGYYNNLSLLMNEFKNGNKEANIENNYSFMLFKIKINTSWGDFLEIIFDENDLDKIIEYIEEFLNNNYLKINNKIFDTKKMGNFKITINITSNKKNLFINSNVNNFFFFDNLHPTQKIHELAAEYYYEIANNWF